MIGEGFGFGVLVYGCDFVILLYKGVVGDWVDRELFFFINILFLSYFGFSYVMVGMYLGVELGFFFYFLKILFVWFEIGYWVLCWYEIW